MLFWIVTGALGIGVSLALWRAVLSRQDGGARPTAAYDLDVYRAQLKELDRDAARGVIGAEEAERARVEISRRILEADRAMGGESTGRPGSTLPVAVLLLTLLGGTYGIYALIGAPLYPDQPRAARIAAIEAARAARPDQAMAEAAAPAFPAVEIPEEEAARIDALRARMEREPEDTAGWQDLARAEAGLRNYRAARLAQERAIEGLGAAATARDWTTLARMQVLAAGGYVSPEAEAALNAALERDPRNGDARFLLGAMYQRQDRPDLAFRIWRDLLAESSPDAPWVRPILEQIEAVAYFAGERLDLAAIAPGPAAPGPLRGPTAEQMEAARDMDPEERMAMIEGMVAGLAAELAEDGGPPERWARLVGALAVLGREAEAREVLAEARSVFAGDAAALALLEEAAAPLPPAPPDPAPLPAPGPGE